jgi:hypothetical protein
VQLEIRESTIDFLQVLCRQFDATPNASYGGCSVCPGRNPAT